MNFLDTTPRATCPSAASLRPVLRLFGTASLALAPLFGQAAITDPLGDFLPTFAGSLSSTDLDVLSASAVFDPTANTFTLSATLAGAPGTTAGGLYVWGANTGTNATPFAANGLAGVMFDTVILVSPTGTSSIAGGPTLAPGAVTVSGDTITAVVSGSLLGAKGGFAESAYTWNIWPRDTLAVTAVNFDHISDFAPDNSNFATTLAVPEPQTYALMLAGLGVLGWVAKRRKA